MGPCLMPLRWCSCSSHACCFGRRALGRVLHAPELWGKRLYCILLMASDVEVRSYCAFRLSTLLGLVTSFAGFGRFSMYRRRGKPKNSRRFAQGLFQTRIPSPQLRFHLCLKGAPSIRTPPSHAPCKQEVECGPPARPIIISETRGNPSKQQ